MADSGAVNRDGFILEWVREGTGIPMMVLGSHRYYRRAFPASLRDHFDVVFCDSRQWAKTPSGFDLTAMTLDTLSDDVEAIRGAVGLDRPVVVGHSQHAGIALRYARQHPGQVRGVVALAIGPPGGVAAEDMVDFFLADATPERRSAYFRRREAGPVHETVTTSDEYIDNYLSNGPAAWFDADYDGAWLWDGVEVNVEVMQHVESAALSSGLAGSAPLIVPLFLGLGRFDYGTPFHLWDEPRRELSNLRYRLYERSGHTPQLEQPDEFVADVAAWATGL